MYSGATARESGGRWIVTEGEIEEFLAGLTSPIDLMLADRDRYVAYIIRSSSV